MATPSRCEWVPEGDPLYAAYHDEESGIANARAILALGESLDGYLWSFVGGAPRQNRWRTLADIPPETEESKAMSRDLKRRGFRFVGPTVCYAFMQAVGMVNDHVVSCFRYAALSPGAGRTRRARR